MLTHTRLDSSWIACTSAIRSACWRRWRPGQPAAGPPTSASTPTPPRRTADASLVRTLQDHDWTLRAAVDASGEPVEALLVPGHPFAMRFDGARIAVRGGCNLLSGAWRLSPQNRLEIGRVASTQKACEPPLMAADTAMAAALAAPLEARVEAGQAPTLHLVSAERQALSFSGRRTSKSLYGAPTRIFLEVAAQRVACTPALQPPSTCLQVRELRFDDKGLRVGAAGPVEGLLRRDRRLHPRARREQRAAHQPVQAAAAAGGRSRRTSTSSTSWSRLAEKK